MIELNLLPPQEKKLLTLERLQRWLLFYGGAILAMAVVFAGLLAATWAFLLIQLKAVTLNLQTQRTSLQGQDLRAQQDLAKETNRQLEKLNQIQINHQYYSAALIELTRLVPSGVRLDTFSLDEKSQATLTGYARQREQVIAIQTALEGSVFFENVESPLANLVKSADINFSFNFILRPENLKQ